MPDLDATRTVTIAELASARDITRRAARALVTRRRWTKRTGNDGTLRVDVPVSELEAKASPKGRRKDVPKDRPDDPPMNRPSDGPMNGPMDVLSDTLTDALVALARTEAALKAERERTDELRGDRDRWADLAVQLRADLEAARAIPARRGLAARLWGRAA